MSEPFPSLMNELQGFVCKMVTGGVCRAQFGDGNAFSERKRFGVTRSTATPTTLHSQVGGEAKYNEGCSIVQNREKELRLIYGPLKSP